MCLGEMAINMARMERTTESAQVAQGAQLQRGQGKERYASKSSLLAITQTLVKLFVSSGRH